MLDVFQDHFKFKARFPVKAIFPAIPKTLGLFWTSVFGDYPSPIAKAIEKEFFCRIKPLAPNSQLLTLSCTEGDALMWQTELHVTGNWQPSAYALNQGFNGRA